MSRSRSGAGDSPRNERAARVAEMRRQQQARDRRVKVVQWGVAALVVLAMAGGAAFVIVKEQRNRPDLSSVQSFEVTQGHVAGPVTYNATPPAGGEHNPVWLDCGTYDQPVPNENAVHSQEHGAVWVTYRPDLAAAEVDSLKSQLTDTYEILSPFPNLPAPVVISAWGKQLSLTGADDKRLAAFVKEYRQSASAPESGAACTGGTNGTASSTEAGG